MRNKRYIIIEILLLFFLSTIITFGVYSLFKTHLGNNKEYHVVFHDVDGLIIGSPVRLMGVDIGTVQKIQNIYDDVHLTFIITDKNFVIPEKAVVTIQFTGIAGSKSLELMPLAKCQQYDCAMLTIEPIRINKAFSIQNAIMESLVGYTKSISDAIGNNSAKDVNSLFEKSVKKTDQLNVEFDKANYSIRKVTNNVSANSDKVQKTLIESANSFKGEEKNFVKSLKEFSSLNNFNNFVKTNLSKNNIDNARKKLKNTHKVVKNLNYEKDWYGRSYEVAEVVGFYVGETSKIVDGVANFISTNNLEHIQKEVTALKKETKNLTNKDLNSKP